MKLNHTLPIITVLGLAFTLANTQPVQATTYTWAVTNGNWSTPTNWTLPTAGSNGPLAADSVIFGAGYPSSNSTAVNNTVDLNFAGTITGLTYNSTNPATFNVTQIPSGQTLTVTGPVLVGGVNGVSTAIATQAYLTGGGALVATGSSFTVQNYENTTRNGATSYCNLSGLNYFTYNNSAGTLSVVGIPTSGNTGLGGNLALASVSNFIDAATINLGTSTSAQAGPAGTFTLGAGANVINVATFNIANNKSSFTVANTGGTLKIRGVSGADTDRPTITLGNRSQTGTGTCSGTLALNGCSVNIKVGTLAVGANPNTGTTTGDTGTGIVLFDTGTLDATNIVMATSATANGVANGTISVGANGTLVVGAGGVSLVNQAAGAGTCTGTINIAAGGTVNCGGNITEGNTIGTGNLNIGGTLIMGENTVIGTTALPVNNITLSNNATLELALSSSGQANAVAGTLNWPANDATMTIDIVGLPAGAQINSAYPIIQYGSFNGTFTAPNLILPAGVSGTLANNGSAIVLTLTGGVGPGIGGINQLINPGFELPPAKAGWTSTTNTSVVTTNATAFYKNGTNGVCAHDATTNLVVSHTGTNVAVLHGANNGSANTGFLSQTIATIAGSTWTAGAFTYISHQDLMAGKNSFYYEVNFLDPNGVLLASYESFVVTNLVCGETTPFALDTWVLLGVTNEMEVIGGVNTGTVVTNIASGILAAPGNSASVQFEAVFLQQGGADANDGGSVYIDDLNLGLVSGPVPPTLSDVSPSQVTLCTNTSLTCMAISTNTTITNVQVIVTSSALGGAPITVTNSLGSPGLTVTGIGTGTASVSYALATNTVYSSIVVKATDANGVTVSSPADSLDTLVPALVIEAADFNYNGGQFIDTPANGGLALYAGQVGASGVDEYTNGRPATKSYYRPNDSVIIQAAAPTSRTEQKFVTALANGDTTDVEVEVGYNSPGNWLNYTRTFGSDPTNSAPAGSYNVWLYTATTGTGVQDELYQVTSDPTQGNQTSNFLGYFGTSAYANTSYNNFVYLPLVDAFGTRVTVSLNGTETLKSVVAPSPANPNLGFFMLTPPAPLVTPSLSYVYPDGAVPLEGTNQFTFTVTANSGAPISTSGISLLLNGVNVSSKLSFTQLGNTWTVSYPIHQNALYTAVINVTNTAQLSATYTVSFDTFNESNFEWEAVDYDFSANGVTGGVFIDNPVPTADTTAPPASGYYETNSYFGFPEDLIGVSTPLQGVDVGWVNVAGQTAYYRADIVGTQVASDYLRPKFAAAQQEFSDPHIGPFNIGYYTTGSWLNYTRTYPTNNFYVWGRLAGVSSFSGTTMSIVTSGAGTANQTSNVLGTFSDPNAAGYQVWHWIPLLDTNGNMVVVPLAGQATLKVTSGNNVNLEFFMLAPAPPQFTVAASLVGGQLKLSFPTETGYTYTVVYKSSLNASAWTPVGTGIAGDGLVHVVAEGTQQGYYTVAAE